jgi:hypothetical protein
VTKLFLTVTWILFAPCLIGHDAQAENRRLTAKEVELLVMNVPIGVSVKRDGGCPEAGYAEVGPDLAWSQLRDMCPPYGSGLLGNFVVDVHSGRIWSDVDRTAEVDSPRLQELRKRLLADTK